MQDSSNFKISSPFVAFPAPIFPYTSPVMAMCPLCSERPGKRYCPAKDVQICAVCCGTKREVEIDCPAPCPYLRSSRLYEMEKERRIPDPELEARVRRFDESFVERNHQAMDAVCIAVAEERPNAPWLVDSDVIEVYKALSATMKTLSSGIYYESLPDGTVRIALFHRLKALLDQLMQPDPDASRRTLKVSEAIDVLDFLTVAAEANSSVRPRSRRYIDWVSETFSGDAPAPQSSGLILP